jgi:hypothetical protein
MPDWKREIRVRRKGEYAMSALSSNTLFHFTDTRENLRNILANEFRPHYCMEDYSVLGGVEPGTDDSQLIAFPLVSFCDIPLAQAKDHMKTYGRYALGLTKEWGMTKGLAPVLYAHAHATIVKSLLEVHGATQDDPKNPIGEHIIKLMCHLKPYEGSFWRHGQQQHDAVRFYDEREWRFVPPNIAAIGFLVGEAARSKAAKTNAHRRVEDIRISFAPADIRYVIVASEKEILPMIDELHRIKSKKYSPDEVRLLSSRIMTAENILEDF